jgi:4'-phosphopantetheinyl transferase
MRTPRWRAGLAQLELPAGAMHIWRADLTRCSGGLESLLSDEERERMLGFHDSRKGALWLRSRGLLRALLGGYTNVPPGDLVFEQEGRYGKPRLTAQDGTPPLHFNLSHSGERALFAFYGGGPVGVDIERPRPGLDAVRLARRVLDPADAVRLQRLRAAMRGRAFLAAWVLREASVKRQASALIRAGQDGERASGWHTVFDAGDGYLAAVASLRAPGRVAYLEANDWPGASPPVRPAHLLERAPTTV